MLLNQLSKRNDVIIIIFCLFIFKLGFSQVNNYELYSDDDLLRYFNCKFYYDNDNFKDSLPDGRYIVFNNLKKDSLKEKDTINIARYENGLKNGLFVTMSYNLEGNLKHKQITFFKDSKKNGIDKKYHVTYDRLYPTIIMDYYGEYLDGLKNGFFIEFNHGNTTKIELYKNDSLVESNIIYNEGLFVIKKKTEKFQIFRRKKNVIEDVDTLYPTDFGIDKLKVSKSLENPSND